MESQAPDLRKQKKPPADSAGGLRSTPAGGYKQGLQMQGSRYQPSERKAIRLIQMRPVSVKGDTAELACAPRYGCDILRAISSVAGTNGYPAQAGWGNPKSGAGSRSRSTAQATTSASDLGKGEPVPGFGEGKTEYKHEKKRARDPNRKEVR